MKKFFSCLTFIILLGYPSLVIAKGLNNYIISNTQAGNIKVGMFRKEVLSFFDNNQIKERIEVGEEEWEFKVINIFLSNTVKPSMSIQMDSNCKGPCKILTMEIYDPKFITSKGIHVGNSFGELVEKHGLDKIYGVNKEAQFDCLFDKCEPIVYTRDLKNVGFILDSKGAQWRFGEELKLQDIPKQTKIKSIYLF